MRHLWDRLRMALRERPPRAGVCEECGAVVPADSGVRTPVHVWCDEHGQYGLEGLAW